jgi:hypothetical protein
MAESKETETRGGTRQISGQFPGEHVQAFRVLAARQDKDVQTLLAEAINGVFERNNLPNRIPIVSGRRRFRAGSLEQK